MWAGIVLALAGVLVGSSPLQAVLPGHVWSQRFGDLSGSQIGHSVVLDGLGNTVVTGEFLGTIDFGGGPLTTNTTVPDMFVAKFDATGNHLWSKRFGDAAQQVGAAVALDSQGNILVTGYFAGTINFGGGNLVNLGALNVFLVKLDPNGNHIWSRQYGSAGGNQEGLSVAVDAADNIVITGFMAQSADFGGGLLTSAGVMDIFVAKFDANANHLWSRVYGDAVNQSGRSVAVDGNGNVLIAGEFQGSADFGGGALASAGGFDIFVAKLDSNGNHVWSRRFGDASAQHGRAVDADGSGNVALTGDFQGSVDFGGGPLSSTGDEDIFAAQLDASGAHTWSRRFGNSPSIQHGNAVAFDAAGNVLLAGNFAGTVDFGGGPLSGGGMYVALFNGGGAHLGSQMFGSSSSHECWSITANSIGSAAITGALHGTADFGGGPLSSTGGSDDVFVAKFHDDQVVPVLISSFAATAMADGVRISWDLWSDEALETYALDRREAGESQSIRLTQGDAQGTRSYTDANVRPGRTYHYELVIHTAHGDAYRSPAVTVTIAPVAVSLHQNSPNPFNPRTTIEYSVGEPTAVTIEIFAASGTRVARLVQGMRDAGSYRAEWDGRDAAGRRLPSGAYFYRLAGSRAAPRQMVLLK